MEDPDWRLVRVVVDSCTKCPYFRAKDEDLFQCAKVGSFFEIPFQHENGIAPYCPLPSAGVKHGG